MLKSKNKLLHKALAFVLTFSLLATLVSFNFTANAAGGTYGGGNGTASDPYIIDDVADLTAFATLVNGGDTDACAKLSDNFSGEITSSWTTIGDEAHKFTGVFDGNNQTITFSSITDGDYVGLFGINEGTIKNVTVAGSISSSTAKAFVGGVAGLNRGTIINCTNSATISTTGANSYAGGIAGVMQYGTIETCTNNVNVSVQVSDTTTGDITDHEASAGGIVAFNYNGTVKKSTNTGNITNNDSHGYTGGIVGNNDGVIDNCLNKGTVSNDAAADYVGGIAGNLFTNSETGSTSTISNSLNTNDKGNVYGSNGLTTKEETEGIVTNCYYKAETTTEEVEGIKGVSQDDLNNGAVTYMLNGNSAANPVWGQDLTSSENTLPMIGASNSNTVYVDETSDKGYSNNKPECSHETYVNGVCPACGDIIAKVAGYSITLDGSIGFNFYFDIKNTYNNPTVSFTINGEPITGTTLSQCAGADTNFQRYLSTIYIDADQMNLDIIATLKYDTNSTDVVTSKPYNVNKYLNTIYSDPTSLLNGNNANKSSELKALAQSMSTYGYFANEYFGDYNHYETSVPQNALTVNSSIIDNDKYNMSVSGNAGTLTHYATSLQHLETITCVFYVQGNVTDDTVMGYRTKSISSGNYTDDGTTSTVAVTKGAGNYSWAATKKIPISKLNDIQFEVTFGTESEGTYTASSNIKTYSPYGYIKTILNKYETSGNTTDSSYKLAQALYHYSEAAAAYFA